jgi:CDP-paratose 2-epimerase
MPNAASTTAIPASAQAGRPPPGGRAAHAPRPLRDRLGVCQWFHFEDRRAVDQSIELLAELGIRHLRTGISWADYFRPGGPAWYDWQMGRLRQSGVEILLSVWHTPPSIAEGGACNGPPRRLRDYADFIDRVITDYGDCWHHLELWNEPNNRFKWDFERHDPGWRKFARMIVNAANWAQRRGRRTVLGGMIPVDHHWLNLMRDLGALAFIDVVAIHAFPGMWFADRPNWEWFRDWHGWAEKLAYVRAHAGGRPVWVTETGLATWDLARDREARFDLQARAIEDLVEAPAERFYFYSLIDLDPRREAIEGFHVDENEYHMGLVRHDGTRKPAFHRLRELLGRSSVDDDVLANVKRIVST